MKHLLIGLMLSLLALAGITAAQEPEATLEPSPTIIAVTGFEPRAMIAGNIRTITVYGANFTDKTTVRLVTMGLGKVTFVNRTMLQVELPETFPAGNFPLEVNDPLLGTATAPYTLLVSAPTATPGPTQEPQPIPTLAIPTTIPGKPLLVTRNFSTNPASIAPGGAVTLTFEVLNQGNQVAQGVNVTLASGSKFLPASGQASATLPDIFPAASASASLTVNAALDAPNGPNIIPLTLTYRDPEGEVITNTVNLSVNVVAQTNAAQVMIARYRYLPSILRPGDEATITLLITNSGSEAARGILIRLGKDGILLPGPNGDSVSVGDLKPNESIAIDLPAIVKQDAKPGMQQQPLTITYSRASSADPVEVSSGITLNVSPSEVQAPLILLQTYNALSEGQKVDYLKPGQRFTLEFTIENRGNVGLHNVLVAFGTVETSGGTTGDSGSGSGGTGGSTTVQPSVTFAPLGSGGTVFVDALDAGGEIHLSQEFIVNGTTKSGIYPLPISLNYRDAANAATQNLLNASLVVVSLPRLQINLPMPMPEMAYTNEPLPLSLAVKNLSGGVVKLTDYEVTASQGEVTEGGKGVLSNMAADDELPINAIIMPSEVGEVEITFVLRYVDDLNQTRELSETYKVNIEEAPIIEEPPIEETPPPETPVAPEPVSFGRFLLALLGLGS